MSLQKHIDNVKDFCHKAGQPVPTEKTYPTIKARELRARLILEEALEMVEALGFVLIKKDIEDDVIGSADDFEYQCVGPLDHIGVMDAAVDLLWVGVTGPAVLCGLSDKLEECIEAIDQNNLEKFKSGHRCEVTGKWIKSPNHKKPNLESIINNEKELPNT